jgi:hypothetical protein
MDLNAFETNLVSRVAEILLTKAIEDAPGRIRRALAGPEKAQAISRAYHRAIASFIRTLPQGADTYIDVIEQFFTDEMVTSEFATLLDPTSDAEFDLGLLRQRFQEIGFDLSTMPDFSFERSMQSFAATFTQEATDHPELRSILSYQRLQRIDAKLSALVSMQEESESTLKQLSERLIVQQQTVYGALSSQWPIQAERSYRYPSQQLVRYISLATDSTVSEYTVKLFETFAMTPSNLIEASGDATEFVLGAEDFHLVVQMLRHVGQRISLEAGHSAERAVRVIADEVTREMKEAIRLQRQKSSRPAPPEARQMRDAGIPYVVLGVAPQFASWIEAFRTVLHYPGVGPEPVRVSKEIYFESVEDAQEVIAIISRVAAASDGDEERFLSSLLDEAMGRVLNKAGFQLPSEPQTSAAGASQNPIAPLSPVISPIDNPAPSSADRAAEALQRAGAKRSRRAQKRKRP